MSLTNWRDNGWLSEHKTSAQEISDLLSLYDLSVINCIVRYQKMNRNPRMNLRSAVIKFCRRSLMKIVKTETRSAA